MIKYKYMSNETAYRRRTAQAIITAAAALSLMGCESGAATPVDKPAVSADQAAAPAAEPLRGDRQLSAGFTSCVPASGSEAWMMYVPEGLSRSHAEIASFLGVSVMHLESSGSIGPANCEQGSSAAQLDGTAEPNHYAVTGEVNFDSCVAVAANSEEPAAIENNTSLVLVCADPDPRS